MKPLSTKTRRGQQAAQVGQLSGLQAGLLAQLPDGGGAVVLPGVQLARGQLQQHLVEGVAVLLHQGNVVLLIQGQDSHAAGVFHHFPGGHLAVGQLGLVYF